MQRPISDIKALHTDVRTSKTRSAASIDKGSFKNHLSAIRNEESFRQAVAPYLRSRSVTGVKNPMKFGIMQSTLKDYDPADRLAEHVSELDENKAARIYRMIWERAGCSNLSPDLAEQHFAAYVMRPRTANEALQKSGGDPAKYAVAIKTVSSKRSYAEGHALKQSLGKVAEEHSLSTGTTKRSVIAYEQIPENPLVIETATGNVMPVLPQRTGPEIRNEAAEATLQSGDTDKSTTVVLEAGSPGLSVPLKFFRASEASHGIMPDKRNVTEHPVDDGEARIVIEKRNVQSGIDAYERARSGKVFADGMIVKLRIPF